MDFIDLAIALILWAVILGFAWGCAQLLSVDGRT